jgi:hypothetical protein
MLRSSPPTVAEQQMHTLWYAGPSGGEDVPNPAAAWMHEVMRRGEDYWGPFSSVGVLCWHEHPPQRKLTRGGLGTATEVSQILFIRHAKRGWFFEFSADREQHRWLVPAPREGEPEKWVRQWAYGEQLCFLAGCFVPQEVAERIVEDFLATMEPSPSVRWVDFETLTPRRSSAPRRRRG